MIAACFSLTLLVPLGFVIKCLRARIALLLALVVFVVVAVVVAVVVLPYGIVFMSLGLLASAALENHHQSVDSFSSRLSSGGSF